MSQRKSFQPTIKPDRVGATFIGSLSSKASEWYAASTTSPAIGVRQRCNWSFAPTPLAVRSRGPGASRLRRPQAPQPRQSGKATLTSGLEQNVSAPACSASISKSSPCRHWPAQWPRRWFGPACPGRIYNHIVHTRRHHVKQKHTQKAVRRWRLIALVASRPAVHLQRFAPPGLTAIEMSLSHVFARHLSIAGEDVGTEPWLWRERHSARPPPTDSIQARSRGDGLPLLPQFAQ